MKYKGIKDACALTKSYCRKDSRGEWVAIWAKDGELFTKVIPNGWWLRFDDEEPDAIIYAKVPMTMKQIEQELDNYIPLEY